MSSATLATRTTYQDVLDAPEGSVAEILDGQLFMQARPMPPHDSARSRLVMILGAPYELGWGGPGGWWIRAEPEIHFGDPNFRTLAPDLAGWRRERMPEIPTDGRYRVAPDWVCEILSPATEARDRRIKPRIYAEEGVRFLWLANPEARRLECFELQDGDWTSTEAPLAPFDAAPFDPRDLWT